MSPPIPVGWWSTEDVLPGKIVADFKPLHGACIDDIPFQAIPYRGPESPCPLADSTVCALFVKADGQLVPKTMTNTCFAYKYGAVRILYGGMCDADCRLPTRAELGLELDVESAVLSDEAEPAGLEAAPEGEERPLPLEASDEQLAPADGDSAWALEMAGLFVADASAEAASEFDL